MATGIEALKDQWKLALLPVFLTAVAYRHRSLYLYAFLGGMTLAMGITFLARFGLVHYADVSPTHLTPKTFHVIYNPLLAFASTWPCMSQSGAKLAKSLLFDVSCFPLPG